MSSPMRTGRLRRSMLPATVLAAGILGADGAAEPPRAQYPSNFEPYNAYYYSLHAPYYYYIPPAPAPVPRRAEPAAPVSLLNAWGWDWWGGGWQGHWGWRGGHGGHR